jgi:DNA sulfur modification protein DndB
MAAPTKSDAEPQISVVLNQPDILSSEFRLRRDELEYKTIHSSQDEEYYAKGWELHLAGTSRVRVKRTKPHDVRLEDRVWSLLFRMGYPELGGRNCKIKFKRVDGSQDEKQIDVFAKDDETVLIIECKSCEERKRRPLQRDLAETDNIRKAISSSIKKHYGNGFNPKIVFIYVTTNVIWSEQDLDRAEATGIRVITENELQYFEAFIGHIGTAGRYQFLAEFLDGQTIPGLADKKVPAVRGSFGKHTFFSFAITPRHLLKIAFVNHQALNHPDGRPAYQRMINKKRIKQIGSFISGGGFFPTNILINFTEKVRFDLLSNSGAADKSLKFGWLYLPDKYKSAWVIDGQHRLYGFSNLDPKFLDQSLFVLAFEKLDSQTEAELFITINHEQKSVPKSLLIALQADLKLGSSDTRERLGALCSALVKSFSADASSPFFGRISVPGITPTDSQNLTIPEIVKGLTRSTLVGKIVQKKTLAPGYLTHQTDHKTIARARKVINGYFRALMEASPARWRAGRSAYISVNPGVRAHLQLINECLKSIELNSALDINNATEDQLIDELTKFCQPIFDFVRSASDSEIQDRFSKRFGEGGVVQYLYHLYDILKRKHHNFGPKDYIDFKSKQSDTRAKNTTDDVLFIQDLVGRIVIDTLKKSHGLKEMRSGEKSYWELGIENLDIKQNAFRKQQMEPPERRAPKEAYLDFMDYPKIVRQKNNWEFFEPLLSIPMPGEKGKTYYLDWMERFNELRRVAAHKTAARTYEPDDYTFLDWLKSELYPRAERGGFEL